MYTPDDTVAAMLFYLGVEEIPSSYREIHSSLYRVKIKYPKLLEEFVFTRNDEYPFSSLLERVIFRLCQADIIGVFGQDFDRIKIPRESKDYLEKNILPLFSEDERGVLKEMATLFRKNMFHEIL